ncbi:hypothetical protein ACOSQ3_022633 [Xanthoceras sorbifolium]
MLSVANWEWFFGFVYQDRWLPRPSTFKVLSQPILSNALTVNQLKLASAEWNVPPIQHAFLPKDAAAILIFAN